MRRDFSRSSWSQHPQTGTIGGGNDDGSVLGRRLLSDSGRLGSRAAIGHDGRRRRYGCGCSRDRFASVIFARYSRSASAETAA
jgi:hypothetical protein